MRIVIISVFLLFSSSGFTADFSVINTNDAGAGSLRQAINDANTLGGGPHIITFMPAYPLFGLIGLQSSLPLITASEVRIHGEDRSPIIGGGNNHAILRTDVGVTLEVEDLNFQFGRNEDGGCIASNSVVGSGSLRVRRSFFTGCVATAPGISGGGAIHWNQDPPSLVTIEDSGFFGNTAITTDTATEQPRGGAASISSTAIIRRTLFRNNSVQSAGNRGGFGGALFIATPENGVSEISGCTFDSNSVDTAVTFLGQGGGVSAQHGSEAILLLERNFFTENSARFGGGIFVQAITGATNIVVAADNNTFVENSATVAGGGMDAFDLEVSLRHSTFYLNDSPSGSHLRMNQVEIVSLTHNVLADPISGPACDLTNTTLNAPTIVGNLFEQACGVLSSVGGAISSNLGVLEIDTGPPVGIVKFADGADPIDGGTTDGTGCLSIDARGNPRPVDGDGDGTVACDVGAYEAPFRPLFGDGFEDPD